LASEGSSAAAVEVTRVGSAPRAAVEEADERLPLSTILLYNLPAVGLGYMFLLVSLYLMKFSTDVLMVSPLAMGTIFMVGRIWDGLAQPIAGLLSDGTNTRWGRRRPWMLASTIPLALLFLAVWAPPASLTGAGLTAWMAVGVIGFFSATVVFIVPHTSLGAELSSNYHERTRVFSYRHVAWTIGSLLALVGMAMLIGAERPRETAMAVGAVTGLATAALVAWSSVRLRERPEYQGRGETNPFKAYGHVWQNPHAQLILIVFFIENLGGATIGILTPYIGQYIVGTPQYVPLYILCYMIASIGSVPIWLPLSRRFGKKNLWLFSMVLTALAFGGMFFLYEGAIVLISVLAVLAGIGGGCGGIVGPSIQSDVIDYDEYMSGQRKEGAYFAAWGLAFQSATGITMFLTGYVLALSGFVPNAEQTETAKLALLSLYALFPLVCYGIGSWLFARFALDERAHAEIRLELDARARARRSG
jgi:GPH family glycoside/pentoside/hexuronide:cation symporter